MRPIRNFLIFAMMATALGIGQSQPPSTPDVAPAPAVDAFRLPVDRGAVALWQSLRKLQTRASILTIVAHPDDEDGAMLTYESRGQGARVALMTLTRGEGGQNVMSDDYWDALGQVRTQELLAAGRYYGVDQYFGRVVDFGFSKTKEEALEKWGHDRLLYDAVRLVRLLRPLVITSTFVGGPTDGHGHHQVSGVMAQEVFNAAADPNMFPDQIKAGLLPWKPLKVYARIPFFAATPQGMFDYATGKYVPVRFYDYVNKKWIEGPLSADVEIPSAGYDPVLGDGYTQVARTGLGFQKSQNGGTGPVPPGAAVAGASYHRFASAVATSDKEKSFFDGIDVSLAGIATLAQGGNATFLKQGLVPVSAAINDAVAVYSVQQPEKTAPALARGLKATRALLAQVEQSGLSAESKYNIARELRVKEREFNDAIAQALGATLLATVAPDREAAGRGPGGPGLAETFQVAIPGQSFSVRVNATAQAPGDVKVEKIGLNTPPGESWQVEPQGATPASLGNNKAAATRFRVTVAKNAKFTRPYFERPDIEQAWYELKDERYNGLPFTPYPLVAELVLNYDGEPVRVEQVVQTVRRVTGPGLDLQPLIVGPAISVSISPKQGVVPLSGTTFNLTVSLRSNAKEEAKGTLNLDLPAGWKSVPAEAPFAFSRDGEEQRVNFEITPGKLDARPYKVTAVAHYNGENFSEGFVNTGYEGLRHYPLYAAATFHTRGVDVKIANGLRVAYVMGTGDEVPKSLEDLGVKAQFLSPQDLASADLSHYDCIVLGVRAYSARPELASYNSRLLDYVKNGGVVFVQYNDRQYDHNYGPYPYTLGDAERVVDETAKVNILEGSNPLMSWPNKITAADFDGWVEERGHSFLQKWDEHYQALTETHDPEQDPQKGGLLYARYGKGAYIYAAYALYRQLPEGVPGAFRLMANILSVAKSPEVAGAKSAGQGQSAKASVK